MYSLSTCFYVYYFYILRRPDGNYKIDLSEDYKKSSEETSIEFAFKITNKSGKGRLAKGRSAKGQALDMESIIEDKYSHLRALAQFQLKFSFKTEIYKSNDESIYDIVTFIISRGGVLIDGQDKYRQLRQLRMKKIVQSSLAY